MRLAACCTSQCQPLVPSPAKQWLKQVFSKAGDVQRIIMGLDKHDKTPCGFCFVVYYTREDAEAAVKYLNGTLVDERNIRVDIDWGFRDGRQFGRGKSGGQVRYGFLLAVPLAFSLQHPERLVG